MAIILDQRQLKMYLAGAMIKALTLHSGVGRSFQRDVIVKIG